MKNREAYQWQAIYNHRHLKSFSSAQYQNVIIMNENIAAVVLAFECRDKAHEIPTPPTPTSVTVPEQNCHLVELERDTKTCCRTMRWLAVSNCRCYLCLSLFLLQHRQFCDAVRAAIATIESLVEGMEASADDIERAVRDAVRQTRRMLQNRSHPSL